MDSTRTTTRDIRRHNRSVLLSKLFFDGPLSRLELSQQTGLSSATVSTVTAELIEDQLIIEAGQVDTRPWITHRFSLADTPKIFPEKIAGNPNVLKAMIEAA